MKRITITIDGVTGAGKGTTAKGLAQKLGYAYIDSGAMYRVSAIFLSQNNIQPDQDQQIAAALPDLDINFNNDSHVTLNGIDMEGQIRNHDVDLIVPHYAQNPIIRDHVNARQRQLLSAGGFVIDGRDMGSVVFPEAELKIYIDCDAAERARRRALQYGVADQPDEVAKIQAEIEERDRLDKTREHSPLIIPDGAVIVDTTNHTIDSQIQAVYQHALDVINQQNQDLV